MSALEVISGISAVVSIIDASIKLYDKVQIDTKLSVPFTVVLRRLPVVFHTLETYERHLEQRKDALPKSIWAALNKSVGICEKKAKKLRELLEKVFDGQSGAWRTRYSEVLRSLGEGSKIEDLMLGLANEVQSLVSHHAVRFADANQLPIEETTKMMESLVYSASGDERFNSGGPQTNNHHGQSKLDKVEQMYMQKLARHEKALGPDHMSTLDAANNLGMLYRDQGKLEKAEQMYMRALAGKEKALGPNHMSTLETANNLGILYSDQGQLNKAEQMYTRALVGFEKALGPDHRSTLDTTNNIGSLYYRQGELGKAEQMYLRALAGKEKALGPNHMSTLSIINNLGILYSGQGKLNKAEQMYMRALAGNETALGPNHRSTLDTVSNLGMLYYHQSKLEKAEQMVVRALAGYKHALGPDHTSTLDTIQLLWVIYQGQGQLDKAEQMSLQVLAGYEKALGPDHLSTINTINNLGALYHSQDKLDQAEQMYLRALAGIEKAQGPNHMSTVNTVNNLGIVYRDQGQLEKAEQMFTRALAGKEKALGPDHISTLDTMKSLEILRNDQARQGKAQQISLPGLAEEEKALGPAVQSQDKNLPSSAPAMRMQQITQQVRVNKEDARKVLASSAIQALQRYENSGRKADIDMAVKLARESIQTTEHNSDPSVLGRLNNLSAMLVRRYEGTGEIADLEEAIEMSRKAVESTAHNHPSMVPRLRNLATLLGTRYERIEEMVDLEEAIKVIRQAVSFTPHNHADRATVLSFLGVKLHTRYERTSEKVNQEEAIKLAKQAIDLTPRNEPIWAARLKTVGTMLLWQYRRTGEMTDLEEAIKVTRQAIDSTPQNCPNRASRLNELATMLGIRYERASQKADLEQAIGLARQAVESTPLKHPRRADFLISLGIKLDLQHTRTGEIADLDEAIRVIRQAVKSIPHDHPDQARYLSVLGNTLERWYDWTGEMMYLEEAISAARQAVELMRPGDPIRATSLNDFGLKLEKRYNRTGEVAGLEEAIGTARQAVKLTSYDHPDQSRNLGNLGTKLLSRYKQTGEMANLHESICLARKALDLSLHDHPMWAAGLSNLGRILRILYSETGELVHLEEAIKVAKQAVQSTSHDFPQAGLLSHLGANLLERYERTGETADLEEASSCFYDAWSCSTGTPFSRIRAGAQCLKLLVAQTKVDAAMQLGQAVIDLIPTVNTKLLGRNDQQFVMSTFAGVAADVCALLLAAGLPTKALEYLEKGRAVIIGQLVDGRSDIPSLQQRHSGVARRYEQLRDEVNIPISQFEQDVRLSQVINRRREAVAELDACIRKIRGMIGHERFLLSQTGAEMQECAVGGTIVVVNITGFRSDAVLISRTAKKALSLPRLLASDAETWLSKTWTGAEVRRRERPQKNREYLEYLAWLWDVCVSPILDELCSVGEAVDGLPRIWWIGSGLGSSMPFHAAGIHSSGSTKNTFSRAISSYSPSIKALGYAQLRAQARTGPRGSLLIATMPTTPAKTLPPDAHKPPDLPGVVEEKREITNIATSYLTIEPLDLPSVDQVLEKLRGCCIAHFACHGSTDYVDPSNSGLILQKRGDSREAEQDRLTVKKVSELSLAHAHVAYLSACSTAENQTARLLDEVIHVVSGFQVAGFPHVIGCLWPSIDRVCVEVASKFYESLLRRHVGTGWDGRDVALAIQEAVITVREADMTMPLVWAQFVHFGA